MKETNNKNTKKPTPISRKILKPTNTVKVKYQTISRHYTLISENNKNDYVEISENDEDDYTEFMMAVKKTLK